MFRRLTTLLAACLLLPVLTPPASAAPEPGVFTFTGVSRETCFGCGTATGQFVGTFTGVVAGHAYLSASLTMSYTTNNPPSTCLVTGIAYGVMTVSDSARTESWDFAWTRTYHAVVVAAINGPRLGTFTSTFVVVDPVGVPCAGGPVRVDMRGAGEVL